MTTIRRWVLLPHNEPDEAAINRELYNTKGKASHDQGVRNGLNCPMAYVDGKPWRVREVTIHITDPATRGDDGPKEPRP